MSERRVGLMNIDLQKDEQFRITTLIQESSEGSSKRDEGYQIKYGDVSDEEEQDKKSIKSLEQIQTPEVEKQIITYSPNQGKTKAPPLALPLSAFNNQATKQAKDDFQLKTNVSQTNETEIPKKKRQKIFRALQRSNGNRQTLNTNQVTENQTKQKLMLNRVAFEKKRQNHTLLKHWNYCRIRRLQLHRAIADQIIKNIDKNVKLSFENLQVYRSFYSQRSRQEQIFANTIFTDSQRNVENDEALQQNCHSYNIYITLSSIFQSAARKDKKQKEIAHQFVNLLQTKILKQIFGQYFDNIHKRSLSMREKISQIKAALQKIDQNVCKKLIALETNFTECCQDVKKQANFDFYRTEISFLRKCQSQMILEAKYGQLVMEYHKFVISEEEIRRQLVQKSLKIYSIGFKKYQKDLERVAKNKKEQKEQESIEQSNFRELPQEKQKYSKQIQQIYSIERLINRDLLQRLNENVQKKQEETGSKPKKIEDELNFMNFISKCEIQNFDCHHLIMRKFQISICKQQIWIPGSILITVDKFVHFFINPTREEDLLIYGSRMFAKPESTLKANLVQMLISQNDQLEEQVQIKIVQRISQSRLDKIKSLIRTSAKVQQKVRFAKESDFLQFEDYIADLSK